MVLLLLIYFLPLRVMIALNRKASVHKICEKSILMVQYWQHYGWLWSYWLNCTKTPMCYLCTILWVISGLWNVWGRSRMHFCVFSSGYAYHLVLELLIRKGAFWGSRYSYSLLGCYFRLKKKNKNLKQLLKKQKSNVLKWLQNWRN